MARIRSTTTRIHSRFLPGPLTRSLHWPGNPGSAVTTSTSIVSLPIYDSANDTIAGSGTSPVTIVGFLQVFINQVDQYGNVSVTILNVAGCGNGTGTPAGSTPITGSSPVPIRLITPP